MYSKRTQATEEGDSKSLRISDGQNCSRVRVAGQCWEVKEQQRSSLSQEADSCFSWHPTENRAYLQFLFIFAAWVRLVTKEQLWICKRLQTKGPLARHAHYYAERQILLPLNPRQATKLFGKCAKPIFHTSDRQHGRESKWGYKHKFGSIKGMRSEGKTL